MSMKPIEPGCLVLVIDASEQSLIGLAGIATEKLVNPDGYAGTYWKVSTSQRHHNQKCLLRIGGDESITTETREDCEVPA